MSIDRDSIKFLILEGVAIVVSILLAFSLDALWEERNERQWEREQLKALQEELQQNIHLLDSDRRNGDAYIPRLDQLMNRIEDAPNGTTIDVPTGFLTLLVAWDISDISTGAIDAILSSGNLNRISNIALKTQQYLSKRKWVKA